MYLKRLDIQGFKTFASRTVLEFRPGATAIVGPNGSGKSNVADAVRWVLGEQSYAALRSKRTEDVIFSGGHRRAPAGVAEVSLTIDNSDRLLPLPYNEVTITRRATRSGENEYYLNRSRVRLRDIQDAVAPLGGSYTIINQGLVDSALTLKPDERRRLFEDAAAISVFQSRKAEAEARLRETSVNVERSADLLAELEPRLRSLKRQASVARTHRELQELLQRVLRRHYLQQWREVAQQILASEQAEQLSLQLLEQRRVDQHEAVAELRQLRDQLRQLRDQLGGLHHESSTLHTQAEALQRDLAVGAERLAAFQRRDEEAERALRELRQQQEELALERATLDGRMQAAEARLGEAQHVVAEADRAIAQRVVERRAAREALDAAQREELAANAALHDAQRRIQRLGEQRATLEREQLGLIDVVRQAEAAVLRQQEAVASAETRVQQAQQARQAANQQEENARVALEQLRAERLRADEAIAAARRTFVDLEARFESLNRLQRSYAGTFAGVRAAMQWAEQQQRAGFALVSSLLRTPAELETAIEVALGSRLQNIVVERWQDAEDAIAALKQSGAGRATFLPLDSIRSGSERGASIKSANNAVLGIAAELIDCDDHYRSVAWNLLGRTLVVRDLATARAELRSLGGGWTIVTLAGEQINAGGAVTGGAATKESGTLRRERELRELPEQVDAARQQVNQRTEARRQLDAQIAEAERQQREVDAQRRRLHQDYETQREYESRARRELERAEAARELQQRRHTQVATELTSFANQLATLQGELHQLEGRRDQAQQRLAELRQQEVAHQDEDQRAQQRLTELRAVAGSIEGELRAERALRQSLSQQIQRLIEQQTAVDQRLHTSAAERSQALEQQQLREAQHLALLAQIDRLRQRIDPLEADVERFEEQRTAQEQREAALTGLLLEAETLHGRGQIELQRLRDRRDAIWERAAGDDLEIETLEQAEAEADDATLSLPSDTPTEPTDLAAEPPADLAQQIQQLKVRIQRLGVVNPLALEEYEEAAQRQTFLTNQLDDLRQASEALRQLISELDESMQSRFEATFQAIAVEFEACFQRLFGGGQAKLMLGGAEGEAGKREGYDALGVEILVRPPGKRQQTLSLLSGGERALTATALLFAILKVNPTPFCILDEVDAALDEANVGRFRDLLSELANQTQFMLITHNRGTIEAADTIYGVSMGDDGSSRVLSLRLEEVEVE